MVKNTYKILTLSTLAAVGIAHNSTSINVLAKEKMVEDIHQQVQNPYGLGPEALKAALTNTGSHALVMDLYAKSIIQAPIINLADQNLEEVDKEKIAIIPLHQNTARIHANDWLDNLKPKVINTNENIINFNRQFQEYYNTLIDAVEKANKAVLKKGLNNLTFTIQKNKKAVEELIHDLTIFKNKLYNDNNSFNLDIDHVSAILTGNQALIPQLEKEIESLKGTTESHTFYSHLSYGAGLGAGTVLGTVLIVLGILTIVGTLGFGAKVGAGFITGGITSSGGAIAGAVLGAKQAEAAKNVDNKMIELIAKKDNAHRAILGLTAAKNQLSELQATINLAIDSLTSMKNQWDTMGAKYRGLINGLDSIQPQQLSLVKDDLELAKDDWNDIKKYADILSKDLSNVGKVREE